MALNTTSFSEALYPGIRKWIADGFNQYPAIFKEIANVEMVSRELFDDIDSTGVGLLEETPEGDAAPEEDPLQGYKTNYSVKDYKKIIKITEKMKRGDLYSATAKKLSRSLGRAAARTMDKTWFGIFRNGFTSTFTSYGDAKPLFSTAHPRKDGGTAQSNADGDGTVLTKDSLFTNMLALQEVLDNKGQIINVGQSGKIILMVPPALKKTALIITESELEDETADNNINYFKFTGNIDVVVNPWIAATGIPASGGNAAGSDTAWYLVSKQDHMLNLFIRRNLNISQEEDFETDTLKVKAKTAWAQGWSGWVGVHGSKGDAASYTG